MEGVRVILNLGLKEKRRKQDGQFLLPSAYYGDLQSQACVKTKGTIIFGAGQLSCHMWNTAGFYIVLC